MPMKASCRSGERNSVEMDKPAEFVEGHFAVFMDLEEPSTGVSASDGDAVWLSEKGRLVLFFSEFTSLSPGLLLPEN